MDIFCICRTCLNETETNLISIYSHIVSKESDLSDLNVVANDNKSTQISSILDAITGNKFNSLEFPYPDKICERCLNDLRAAFEFKHRCEIAFEQLIKLNEASSGLSEQNIELQPPLDNDKSIFIETLTDTIVIIENKPLKISPLPKVEQEKRQDATKADVTNKEKQVITTDENVDIKSIGYQCADCDKTFSRKTHLRRHMTIHTDERAFPCKLCDKKFRRADHLKIHENYHAKVKPHTCQHCQKSFSRNEHLRRHILSRHTKKTTTFACTNCEYVGKTAKDLNHHRKSHSDVCYACKICDEKFTSKLELNEHTKSHSNDERPYLCSECGMRFIRNDYLVIHMRRHTGEKPYKCRFCDRAFPRATDLTVHERYHTNEKKHTCDLCGKGFQRAYNLTVHMRVHTGERPYQCPHCSRSFSQGNDLKAHIRRHTGERYQCEYCESSFIQIYLLNNHKKNSHGVVAKSNISRVTKFESTSQETTLISHTETFGQQGDSGCIQYTMDEC